MSETKRVRRSPSEIIQDTEAKLAKARNAQAIEAQGSNPIVSSISDKVETYTKMRTEAMRCWSGNRNQQTKVRRESHQAWIVEINAEEALATAQVNLCNFLRPNYTNLRNQVASLLANGGSDSDAQTMFTNGEEAILSEASALFDMVSDAQATYEQASQARISYIQAKKVGKTSQEATATA